MGYKNWSDWMAKQEAEWEESYRLRREAEEKIKQARIDEVKCRLLSVIPEQGVTRGSMAYDTLAEWVYDLEEAAYHRGYLDGQENAELAAIEASEYD